ncbi:DUF6708 domain-containing protein [Pseudomonas sp. NyZ201]|uniref:DUF6708 domain-containing protein n=1 Tax=Pseudomonas sp. NyZ201 TaxID=3409857 RepID=UPI003CE8D792
MYWIEWMLWYVQTSTYEAKQWQEKLEKIIEINRREVRKGRRRKIFERASESPSAEGSVYEVNERYIEISAGESQERRGVITYMTLSIIFFLSLIVGDAVVLNEVWFTGIHHSLGTAASTSSYVLGLGMFLMAGFMLYVVCRYARIFICLENFVQRRMLIRFNRVTRQVYLHRPRFAGGVTVFDWEQVAVETGAGEEDSANIGRKLILSWGPSMPELPHFHLVFVGKRAEGTSDIVNLWEFIRRYMEEGPQSVPAPKKLLGKVPWPWLSVIASLSFFKPLWRAGLRWQVACIVALASPALALHSVGHWISLLLCWEPRWPRIIREAGLPGKPVPALSTAADWPPLPKVESKEKRPRRTRKSLPADVHLAEKESKTIPGVHFEDEPDTQRQESK